MYLFCRRAYYVGFFNDDAFFIIGARSLLSGRYAELNAPGAPPLVNYLPGFSLLLAPVAALSGAALWPFQLASCGLTLAALWLFGGLAEALCPAAAFAALALAALTPLTASMSGAVLSDAPLLAAAMAALAWARRLWDERSLRRWAPLALLIGFCALLRPTGATLALAFMLALSCEGRWKQAALCGGAACLWVLPFLVRNHALTGHGLMYFLELSRPYEGAGRWASVKLNLALNLGYYLKFAFVTRWLRWPRQWPALVALTVGLGAVATVYGLRDAGWRGWRKLPAIFLAVFCAVHLFWGKQAGRYILPVLPLLFAYLLRGLGVLGARFGRDRQVPLAAAIFSLALLALPDYHIAQAAWRRQSPVTRPPEITLAWVRANSRPEDIFAAELDGRFYLLTGRRVVHIPRIFNPDELQARLKADGARYVAVFPNEFALTTARGDAFNDPMPEGALLTLLSDTARYELVFAQPQERSAIYRVR